MIGTIPSHAKYDGPQRYNHLSEKRGPNEREDGKKCGFIASVTGTCEIWWFDGLSDEGHTPRTCLVSKSVIPNSLVVNIAYRTHISWTITRCKCDRVGKVLFHTTGEDCDPTHSTPRTDIQMAGTCSMLLFRKRELCYRGGRTTRKSTNTVTSSTNEIGRAHV